MLSYSILFTWLAGKTDGSLTAALLFHAALNLFSVKGIDPSRQYWLRALVYGVTAVAVIAAGGLRERPAGMIRNPGGFLLFTLR